MLSMGLHSQLPGLHTISLSLKTQIKEAYHNSSTIPVNKWSIIFGIPLTLQLEQTTATMEAWLLQYQAGQKILANILTQERQKQGTVTRFLISHTQGCCPDKPPGQTHRYSQYPTVFLPSPKLKCDRTNRLARHYYSVLYNLAPIIIIDISLPICNPAFFTNYKTYLFIYFDDVNIDTYTLMIKYFLYNSFSALHFGAQKHLSSEKYLELCSILHKCTAITNFPITTCTLYSLIPCPSQWQVFSVQYSPFVLDTDIQLLPLYVYTFWLL